MGMSRISRLRRRQDAFLQDGTQRRMRSVEEEQAAAEIARNVYTCTSEPVEALRRAEYLEAFAERMPIRIEPDELIVGSMLFCSFRQPRPEGLPEDRPWFQGNGGHVVSDYGRMLRLGICGLRNEIADMPEGTERQRQNKEAFRRSLDAFAVFIRRHAEASREPFVPGQQVSPEVAANCVHVSESAPVTFWQALQLTWFMHVFLHGEASAVAISFGRIDQFLWPFLERDLADGVISMAQAEELVSCFWLKCCEGDESQNLVLGGCDEDGRSAENPLSLLCLRVTRKLRVWQPSVSVRIAAETSSAFWDESLKLCTSGFGMPSFFNDPVVIKALLAAGMPLERARDWSIVGCYEATPQGDCLGRTVHGQWVLPRTLLSYLKTIRDDASGIVGFEDFKDRFKSYMAEEYERLVPQFQASWNRMAEVQASPFRSLCMPGCCESGLCAEEGGVRYSLFGVNTLGIGTLVDSLWAIHELVFTGGDMTLQRVCDQVSGNWPDEQLLKRCRMLRGKFGSDNPATNGLAEEFANHVADLVLGSRLEHGVQPYPALFIFTGWAQMSIPATPDGRRDGEPVSYGVGPSVYCADKTPTSVLKSSAVTANSRCGCGNPMLLTLNGADVRGQDGQQRLRQTIETYFREGGYHLHMNVLDVEQLREAQMRPELHPDLLVRISGLSAQFVTLDRKLQDALIARAELGL